jgi:hypothetical protein
MGSYSASAWVTLLHSSKKGEPFEEPFLVPGIALSTEGSTCYPKRFYLEPKQIILWGQPKNPFGTLVSKSIYYYLRVTVSHY